MIWPHVCNVTTVVTVHAVMEPRIVVKRSSILFWSAKVHCAAGALRRISRGPYKETMRTSGLCSAVRLFLPRDQTSKRGGWTLDRKLWRNIRKQSVHFQFKNNKNRPTRTGPGFRSVVLLRWNELSKPCCIETKYRVGFVKMVLVSEKIDICFKIGTLGICNVSEVEPATSLFSVI